MSRDERGHVNIYKVDQLTALKWSVVAWEGISAATVVYCYSHTGLFVSSTLPSVSYQEEHMAGRGLQDAINILTLTNSMVMSNLINSVEEDEAAHVSFKKNKNMSRW